ncbi:YggT family protein [Candidatus Electrothrix gigas]|jgi:YggT family protein
MALANLIHLVLSAYIWIVVGRAIISWVNPDPYNPIVRFLIQATDPLLEKIRRYIPPMGGLDLSPIILIFALVFLQSFIVNNLMDIGRRLL